jgi:hypothetical protein
VKTPSNSSLPALVLAAAGTALAIAGCGGNDAIVGQLEQQTVTVTVPAAAPSSEAPTAGATSTTTPDGEPPAGGNAGDAAQGDDTAAGGASRRSLTPATSATQAEGAARQESEPTPAERPSAPASATPPQPTVLLRYATALRSRPGGSVVARLAPRTEFSSPVVLPVVGERRGWLAVISSALPNGQVGWISGSATLEAHSSQWRIVASLRHREVVVQRDGRVVMRFPVAVGGPGTPTPQGRFAVTDKLLTGNAASPYGCCILALSGRQPAAPQGWGGGDRIAIHATDLPQTIGTEASLGCLRAPTDDIRRVVSLVPLGTIVRISA